MKHTKSMTYKPTEESRELLLFATNDSRLYFQSIIPAIENLKKKYQKGTFDKEKAADLFYYVATAASNKYFKDYGYKFDVTARYTAAVDMVADYMEDIEA
jgi:hypothetical protein